MSRPPIKALESIKKYCEKTQCRRCLFGRETSDNYVGCELLEYPPCDWDTEPLEVRKNDNE